MTNTRLQSFLLLGFLVGCAPVIPYVANTSIPPISEKYIFSPDNSSTRVLALPLWKVRKGYIDEANLKPYTVILDSAYVLRYSQISDLNKIIPNRVSYGLGGLSNAYSTDIFFVGIYLISEYGDAALLINASKKWVKDVQDWEAILQAPMTEKWLGTLKSTIQSPLVSHAKNFDKDGFWNANYSISCEVFLKGSDLPEQFCTDDIKKNFPNADIQINLSGKERNDSLSFLDSIDLINISTEKSKWVQTF
jgi:hypothetical protein